MRLAAREQTARRAMTVAALTATLGLAAASWIVAVHQMEGMDMGVATELGSFPFFVTAWVTMMAAMMLPGAAPVALGRTRTSKRAALAVPPFVGSYLAVWTRVGLAVYALYRPRGTAWLATLHAWSTTAKLRSRSTRRSRSLRRLRPSSEASLRASTARSSSESAAKASPITTSPRPQRSPTKEAG